MSGPNKIMPNFWITKQQNAHLEMGNQNQSGPKPVSSKPQTRWLMNHRNFVSHSSGGWKSKEPALGVW